MRKRSGSKLPLAMRCPASLALPWIDEPVGDMAIRGTVIHAYLQAVADALTLPHTPQMIEEAIEAALYEAPVETHRFLRSIDLDALAEYLAGQPELAFALDWRNRTARVLGAGLGRAYPADLGPTEIPLTVDICGLGATRVRVSDYKTGRTRYGPAAEFAQLQAGALAACWAYNRDSALVELVYLDDNGDPHVSRGEMDGWALESFAADLERVMDEADAGDRLVAVGSLPDVHPGDHCVEMHCPAYRACPSKSALVRHMPEHLDEIQRPGYMAPARLAQTLRQVKEVKRIADGIEAEIYALSIREPIDLGGGEWLGPCERRTEKVDATIAKSVLAEQLGQAYADKAVTLATTKEAIKEQAKLWRDKHPKEPGPNGKPIRVHIENANGTGVLDRLYYSIRGQGGVTVKVTNEPRVYKKKGELPP